MFETTLLHIIIGTDHIVSYNMGADDLYRVQTWYDMSIILVPYRSTS